MSTEEYIVYEDVICLTIQPNRQYREPSFVESYAVDKGKAFVWVWGFFLMLKNIYN